MYEKALSQRDELYVETNLTWRCSNLKQIQNGSNSYKDNWWLLVTVAVTRNELWLATGDYFAKHAGSIRRQLRQEVPTADEMTLNMT